MKKKNSAINRYDKSMEETLREFSMCPPREALLKLGVPSSGFDGDQVEAQREEFGENVIKTQFTSSRLTRLRDSVINPFNVVLFGVAVITLLTDVLMSPKPDYWTVGIIGALILISSVISFVQGERSNEAAEKLLDMISNKTSIFRDGRFTELPIEEVVVGDIVKLSAGDMIPADVKFLTAKDAFISQSALSGESMPVEKSAGIVTNASSVVTDLDNIGFMGTNVISGAATALVLAVGNNTYFGAMSKTLSGDKAQNSFERGVNSVSRLLISFMVAVIPIVFVINGITKNDWMHSLLFAVALAVGLTPEMLPVIMTSTLAKGAVSMASHKVIVKSLGSIQSLGEMDILCTDKTGTLTEDKIILEKYMDLYGNDDLRVLRHALLNSYFQTGLKNLIDIAIIERAKTNEIFDIINNYRVKDEIPFDFSRRRMSVVLEDKGGKVQLITKGAVEEILSICSYAEYGGKVIRLSEEVKQNAMDVYSLHNNDGLRMIAVAQKNEIHGIHTFGVGDESDMVLIGFIGFLDPPKESAQAAIKALNRYGVRVVVLTGDSEGVAKKVCEKVGVNTLGSMTGSDIENMSETELRDIVEKVDLFSKLSPMQKKRVVKALQDNAHTVGYMGDGINDSLALNQSDVGISVDSAVDIAKETADIILLKKDLMVLEEGVIEGRKTFGNIMKYLKMTASGNFGNIVSIVAASVFLPFLPMLPVQMLTQNLLCDFAQLGISFDNVDSEYVQSPKKWDTASIKNFMLFMGPISSMFDIMLFAVLWYAIGANSVNLAPLFQSGWFVFGTVSQVLVIHMIRTSKTPFIVSKASKPFMISTSAVAVIAVTIGFSDIAVAFDMMRLPVNFIPWLIVLLGGYFVTVQVLKGVYVKKHKEWL